MKKITLLLLFLFSINNAFSQAEVVTDFNWAYATKVNNKIVFMHSTPDYGKELWVSDGTTAGTILLRDINPGPADSTPYLFTLLDDVVYFRANSNQIWRTDGTIGGTYMMVNNPQITNPSNFVKTQNFIFFYEGTAGNSCCHSLWKMNTNPNSETLVTPTDNFTDVSAISVFDYDSDVILFNAKTVSNGWAIWRSNGGVSLMVKDLDTNSSDSAQKGVGIKVGSDYYFAGFTRTGNIGLELWKTDGTTPNTNLIKDILVDDYYYNAGSPSNFIKVGATIYFTAKDNTNGIELWKTNGTEIGTQMIKDVYQGNNNNFNPPQALTEFNNQLYFAQGDISNTGIQIWKSNGTETGTTKVTNLPNAFFTGYEMFATDNNLYFSFNDSVSGGELWKLDTNDNLSLVADITPGTEGSYPTGFFEYNGYVYFTAALNNVSSGIKTYRVIDQSTLSTANFENNLNSSIYPNPTSNVLNIDIQNTTNFNIDIYDIIGKQVGSYKNQKSINISNLTSGMYLVKVIDLENNLTALHKVLKN